MDSQWTTALPLADLPPGTSKVLRFGRERVALFHTVEGGLHAVDERCPHEGYPLSGGPVKDQVLTCPWHNFKFDLRDGHCLMGDEAVRRFPSRIVDGVVEIDLAPPADQRARLLSGLNDAILGFQSGRIAREIVRCLDAGISGPELVGRAVALDADHGEYGPSHVLGWGHDSLELVDEAADPALPLAQLLDFAGEALVRRPARQRPAPLSVADPGVDLRAAVEAEDSGRAEAIVRGALRDGADDAQIEAWIWPLLGDHFLDFGHALIYQAKLPGLLAAVGERDRIWGAHVYGIVNGTREDSLPHWLPYRRAIEAVDPDAWWARRGPGTLPVEALEQRPRDALQAVLESTASTESILAALSLAASRRMLRFDLGIAAAVDNQDGWLDLTHRLTVVDALRVALRRWDDPRRLHILLQVVRFVAAAMPYDGPGEAVAARPGGVAELRAAIADMDREAALGITVSLLERGDDPLVRGLLLDLAMADIAVRGIVVAHMVKTSLAAFRERALTGRTEPVLAVVRWFASPRHERQVGRRVHEARDLVERGRPPTRRVD